jgi:hypothetical protein
VALYVSVYFLFYSAQRVMDLPVVFFVIAADLANERHHHSETTTDASNHKFISHVMPVD